MEQLFEYTIARISALDPKAGVKLQEYAEKGGTPLQLGADRFFSRFQEFLASQGLSIDYGIDCYLKLRDAMAEERVNFLRNNSYSNTSFAQVAKSVYHNPEVMRYHMYGLVLAQFLWPEQYRRYSFFCEGFARFAPQIENYLELGGGHALYAAEALSTLRPGTHIDVVDISASSLDLARGMLPGAPIAWHHADIFDFVPQRRYDFVTMGEVLEHLEDPLAMLHRIRELLAPSGSAYITTPANAPMIDHIYLFNNAQEIRDMFETAGFEIQEETTMYAAEMRPGQAEKLKIPLMYAAFVRPR